jgi:hypothetical protein
MSARAGMKRKGTSHSETAVVQLTHENTTPTAKRQRFNTSDSYRIASMRLQSSTSSARDSVPAEDPSETVERQCTSLPGPTKSSNRPPSPSSAAATSQKINEITSKLSPLLPPGKIFPIRIGSELFQLSGASISSDAPSYFSHYFGEQLLQSGGKANSVKILYIDRDPATFKDIARHLQGYHIVPQDGAHYVRLFADAQFYGLPRLTRQLFKSDIYVQVGERHFQIPKEVLSAPGNTPNFFSLGFAHFFSSPNEVLPDLEGQNLLRPPAILPPAVPNRSGDIFAQLLRILQGYDIDIQSETHRNQLLRDARYFHLKAVEQKLIPCDISFNLERQHREIVLRLEDLRQSGITFKPDKDSPSSSYPAELSKPASPKSVLGNTAEGISRPCPTGWILYQRPYVDQESSELVLEITGPREATRVDPAVLKATFYGETRARIASLFQVIANKMGMPATLPLGLMMIKNGGGVATQPISPANSGLSGDRVRIRIERSSWIEVDGQELEWEEDAEGSLDNEEGGDQTAIPSAKQISGVMEREWIIRKALWRLRMEKSRESDRTEVVLVAVKIEAVTEQRNRNKRRGFLC